MSDERRTDGAGWGMHASDIRTLHAKHDSKVFDAIFAYAIRVDACHGFTA